MMPSRRDRNVGPKRATVVTRVILGMVLTGSVAWGAAGAERQVPTGSGQALGMMAVKGRVWLDQVTVPTSTAVFEGDTVRTEEGSAAVVRMRSGLTMALEGRGEVQFEGGEVWLRQGDLRVSKAGSGAARVQVRGRTVEVREGTSRLLRAGSGAAGKAAILSAAAKHPDPLGTGAAPPARAPQGAVRKAGAVSGEIPSETIQRQGAGAALPLNLHDDVNWKDVVKTEQTGRVRIQLLDGSVLNVGARSQMQIIEHNAQTQQTQVELTLGQVRSHVVKLTKPGASFQMRTQTAVIGVVGTIFVVEATPTSTRVMCIEGRVVVQNINPAVQGRVQLEPGQSTVVEAGLAPTAASATNAAQLQVAMNHTEIEPGLHAAPPEASEVAREAGTQVTRAGTSTAGAAGAGTTGAAGAGTTLSVGSAVVAAAGGVSAVAGVSALNRSNDALTGLNQTNSALQDATAANNAATTAINQQNALSPSTPCGCGP